MEAVGILLVVSISALAAAVVSVVIIYLLGIVVTDYLEVEEVPFKYYTRAIVILTVVLLAVGLYLTGFYWTSFIVILLTTVLLFTLIYIKHRKTK